MTASRIQELLGDKAAYLLEHTSKTVEKSMLTLPSPNHVEEIWVNSNRNNQVLRSLQILIGTGKLANTGYISIFPVDQGIEHSAGSAFALPSLPVSKVWSGKGDSGIHKSKPNIAE